MRDLIEMISILISIGIVVGPIVGFVLYMRHMARKENEVLRRYGYHMDTQNDLGEMEA